MERLNQNAYRPLANKASQGLLSAGFPTYKMIVALAALEAGLVTPDETVNCPGHMDLGQPPLSLLAPRRARADEPDREHQPELRRLLLRGGRGEGGGGGWRSAWASKRFSEMARRFGCGVRHDLPMSGIRRGAGPHDAVEDAEPRRGLGGWAIRLTPPSGRVSCCLRRCILP